MKNTYHLNVDIPEQQVGEYRIRHTMHRPHVPLVRADLRSRIMGGQSAPAVQFEFETRWHELTYEGGTWMTDFPIEQHQHDTELERVTSGCVLIGGLGLGYAIGLLAARPDIESIMVVEISPEVIEMVGPYIKDLDGKVTVVQADLMKFLAQKDEGVRFDWAFFDIWQRDGEDTFFNTVCPLRRMSVENGWVAGDHTVICWNENVMRGQLASGLQTRILNHFMTPPPNCEPVPDRFYAIPDEEMGIFFNWAIPFFEWWYEGRDEKLSQERLNTYAGIYGHVHDGSSDWKDLWEALTKDDPKVPELAYSYEKTLAAQTKPS